MVIGWPLAVAISLLVGFARRWMLLAAPWAALPALVLLALAPRGAHADISWLLLGARFGVDDLSQVFLLLTSVLWLVAGLYGHGYFRDDAGRDRVLAFFLAAMSGNLGLILAQDMISFYFCYALMSFASYGIVIHTLDASALRAGRVYLIMAVIGEVLVFAAMTVAVGSSQSILFSESTRSVARSPQADWLIGLAWSGFGIKVGVVPLHMWLPLAHPAAPTPASAVLSGAMIKAGLLGWLRLLPVGEAAWPEWGNLWIAGGLIAALGGAVVGLTQSNPKTVLAYSSISQMGLMTIAVGVALAVPQSAEVAIGAVLLYAVHHALAKGALFLGVGIVPGARGRLRYLVFPALLIPALALAGVPLTSGAVAKIALKEVAGLGMPAWAQPLSLLLPVAAVGTTLLMARFLYLVWPRGGGHGAARGMIVSWLTLILMSVLAIWSWPAPFAATLIEKSLTLGGLWVLLWPVLLGTGIAIVVGARSRARGVRDPCRFPPVTFWSLLPCVAGGRTRPGTCSCVPS